MSMWKYIPGLHRIYHLILKLIDLNAQYKYAFNIRLISKHHFNVTEIKIKNDHWLKKTHTL